MTRKALCEGQAGGGGVGLHALICTSPAARPAMLLESGLQADLCNTHVLPAALTATQEIHFMLRRCGS